LSFVLTATSTAIWPRLIEAITLRVAVLTTDSVEPVPVPRLTT
jgi:hypothetical protein